MDASFVGRVYPATEEYQVSREKIREFADAIGATHPAHRDPGAARALGYPDVIAPATFAIGITMRAAEAVIFDPALGLDYTRVVHRDQRFEQRRPLNGADAVTVEVTVESAKLLAGNAVLGTRADVRDAAGQVVVRAFTTLVARAEPPASGADNSPDADSPDADSPHAEDSSSADDSPPAGAGR
ncbi:MAG: MaoC family dehydratase N-terminal domain-containing protein [Frankiaceae bacterium]|nr:MaoC family dehydratase N-terminal domain-containing protein [Frankiaceae bacterium]